MKYYFAPMEGITWYVYRNAHYAVFPGIEKYYAPFITPPSGKTAGTLAAGGKRHSKGMRDIDPENNTAGLALVPQILTNKWEDFLETAKVLKSMGYSEVNLNLGCPSGTVAAKGKGSGFLAYGDKLDEFLEKVCASFQTLDMKLSVKTRIGKDDPEEFSGLIEIFNKYPLEMLIVHPRTQKDYYKNTPNMEAFREAMEKSKNLLCYNGDIFSAGDMEKFHSAFPSVEHVMLGRGLVANPGLIKELTGRGPATKEEIRRFHDMVYEEYSRLLFGDRNILFRMKELWAYMIELFPDSGKIGKKIKKAEKLANYEKAVEELFDSYPE